jgi:hypothetical protein
MGIFTRLFSTLTWFALFVWVIMRPHDFSLLKGVHFTHEERYFLFNPLFSLLKKSVTKIIGTGKNFPVMQEFGGFLLTLNGFLVAKLLKSFKFYRISVQVESGV